eukprot:NODE_1423_length_1423_cov_14.397380_g1185_i0.p1 GENE.NODE_1423_length_1423_cov_14.397380_g1185_i0~~NODE_1423_length_1423_cov_14.397380_g1185_i0.p1  ORF type:complete len:453 (-),score=90.70 NODE_1423_length_1423_cov_14.397380_g1185_i0:65-1324(-)
MLYILEQRLHAQNIPQEKRKKVLHDIVGCIFGVSFMTELLRPQPLYTMPAVRDIFDRLSRSSIMRLSTSSFDKLFDLMTMGVKFQVVNCTHPRDLIDVSMNHVSSLASMVSNQPQVVASASTTAMAKVIQLCRDLSVSELAQIRLDLLTFLQGARVKVSMFLHDGLQLPTGVFVLTPGGSLPSDELVEDPGTIRFFDRKGEFRKSVEFVHPYAKHFTGVRRSGDPFNDSTRDCKLGTNLYLVDRRKQGSSGSAAGGSLGGSGTAGSPTAATASSSSASSPKDPSGSISLGADAKPAGKDAFAGRPEERPMSRGGRMTSTSKQQSGGMDELRFLGQMINLRPPSGSTKQLISVDLFSGGTGATAVTSSSAGKEKEEKEITINRVVKDGELVKVMGEFSLIDDKEPSAPPDLLDLLDDSNM